MRPLCFPTVALDKALDSVFGMMMPEGGLGEGEPLPGEGGEPGAGLAPETPPAVADAPAVPPEAQAPPVADAPELPPDNAVQPPAEQPPTQEAPDNPANCFPAGTLVGATAGLKAIEMVQGGERVWAYDLVASR